VIDVRQVGYWNTLPCNYIY